jgi:hypothetical protein
MVGYYFPQRVEHWLFPEAAGPEFNRNADGVHGHERRNFRASLLSASPQAGGVFRQLASRRRERDRLHSHLRTCLWRKGHRRELLYHQCCGIGMVYAEVSKV